MDEDKNRVLDAENIENENDAEGDSVIDQVLWISTRSACSTTTGISRLYCFSILVIMLLKSECTVRIRSG